MNKLTYLFLFLYSGLLYSQVVTSQSNPSLDFNDFLRGVKYAIVEFDKEYQNIVDNSSVADYNPYHLLKKYLLDIGFEYVFLTSKDKQVMEESLSSYCEVTFVEIFWSISPSDEVSDLALEFYSCGGDYFYLHSPERIKSRVSRNSKDLSDSFIKIWKSLLSRKPSYSDMFRLKLPSENTNWTELKIRNYFDSTGNKDIEGIYQGIRMPNDRMGSTYKIGIIRNESNEYDIIYLSGAHNYKDWQEGEKKGKITQTASKNLYLTKWKNADKSIDNDVYCTVDENGVLKFIFSQPETAESFFLKLYPINSNSPIDVKKGTATAFAISQDGYLITSQHVVNNSSNLKVIQSNNSDQTSYEVIIVLEDKNNDLAVLKIIDSKFQRFGPIPFTIKSSVADVGEDVYVVGYPLSTTMGNELKVTDGIISSRTGFQGDITSYQISAPIQPGNSGGAVFDKKGNLIGVVSAKYKGAENVSYAVKSNYLINLLNILEKPPSFPTKNVLVGKTLSEQVKQIRNFIFMIEVY